MQGIIHEINRLQTVKRFGRVSGVRGLLVDIKGVSQYVSVGSRLDVETRDGRIVPIEVIGFSGNEALAMPYGAVEGIGVGCRAVLIPTGPVVFPSQAWLGRVVNAFGEPIDGKGPIYDGDHAMRIKSGPPKASERQRVGGKIDLGVRALNGFINCCSGQRMGIFAGSGVGKSVLMSMIARYAQADISVIGLIGERGREVQEFIEDDLGPEGLAKSVVVVATSDESALMRRQAAYMTLTVAEYFRDIGANVMCLMDSVTRFAMAQREIGLAGGEPPASKGYTPTVFTELPKLLERAGPGPRGAGNITGLFTVLVDGDDHNEPVADAVRGILDGHIVMERSIAERGRYPAINILKSVSRTMPGCNNDYENLLVREAKKYMSTYADMEEMIRLGAYRAGSNPEVDAAIQYHPMFEEFLTQWKDDPTNLMDGYNRIQEILAAGPSLQVLQQAQQAAQQQQMQQQAAPA